MAPRKHTINCYVYIVFRLDGSPCYVGKGRGPRWKQHFRKSHNPHLAAIIAKEGKLPVVLIRENLSDADAHAIEIAFISTIGRKENGGPLVNMTDGGEGLSGHKQTPEHKEKIRIAVWTPDNISKLIKRSTGNTWRRGQTATPETKLKLSVSHLNHRQTQETKDKRAAKNRGKTRSPEHCARQSERMKAQWVRIKSTGGNRL